MGVGRYLILGPFSRDYGTFIVRDLLPLTLSFCSLLQVPTPQNPEANDADDPEALGEAVVPAPDSPYAELGEVEPVNLISFAYQIAHGMVCYMQPPLPIVLISY